MIIFKSKYLLGLLLLLLLLFLSSAVFFYHGRTKAGVFLSNIDNDTVENTKKVDTIKEDRVEKYEIGEGITFAELMTKNASTTYSLAMEICAAAKDVYDLAKVRQGKTIELVYDKISDELKELRYKIDTEDELFIRYKVAIASTSLDGLKEWRAELIPIPYVLKEKVARARIESSMYQAALDNDIDIRAIIELANAFQWSIDFAMDPRVGDTFEFFYEERFLDGEYIMPGQIYAGRYVNDGKETVLYYFEESPENKGFFDAEGNSVQKMFLKAPVAFRYISSGFTTGSRWVQAFNVSTGHRAIDYAAKLGTPIRAVGDGVVTFSGWSSAGYGNLTSIRHNETYSSNYAHQSRLAVKRGQRVSQGQIIGYVGSTGFSTGPHLHFEMVKNGIKINPLREILPPGKPIKDENKKRFFANIEKYQKKLNY